MTEQTATKDKTLDGVEVVPGLAVWDYNLRVTTVVDKTPYTPGWWDTENGGMFDGARMWTRHPSTGQPAAEVLRHEAAAEARVAVSGDFITSSDFSQAWDDLKQKTGKSRLSGVRLERTVGRSGDWRKVDEGPRAALLDYVRGLDGAPIPGRFRLAHG